MSKLGLFFAVCLVLFAVISAVPSFQMEFVNEFMLGRPEIVRISTVEIDLSQPVIVKIKTPDVVDQTTWKFARGFSTPSSMNSQILKQNNFLSANELVTCVDELTHRPIVAASFDVSSSQVMTFSAINSVHSTVYPNGKFGSFKFLCPISVIKGPFAPQYITLSASQATITDDLDFDLTPPAVWSVRSPVITITSASYTANSGTLLGGQIKFNFQTDTAGIHSVAVRNGPQPIYYNRRNQEFTSYQCGTGVEAYIISGKDGLEIHVKDAATNSQNISCLIDVDGYMTAALTERSQVVISMDSLSVAFGVEFPTTDAVFSATTDTVSSTMTEFTVNLSQLDFSFSPLHVNSTIEFRFSGINLNTIKPYETAYRQDTSCSTLQGSFSTDDNSVYIKDISVLSTSVKCQFSFLGAQVVRVDKLNPIPTLQVLVDGVKLYNQASRDTSLPLYLPIKAGFTKPTVKLLQDADTLKYTTEFTLSDKSMNFGVIPQKPIIVFYYDNPGTWPVTSYADALKCDVTTPSSSAYEPLVMTFNLERRAWSAELSSIIVTDVFSIQFRCTRSEAIVSQFGIILNVGNDLRIQFIDVVTGKSFVSSVSALSTSEPYPDQLPIPTSPSLPDAFLAYISTYQGTAFITDFSNLSQSLSDLSAKSLEAIKSGFAKHDETGPIVFDLKPTSISALPIFDSPNTQDYSPSYAQTFYDLLFTIIGFQFQQPKLESIRAYQKYQKYEDVPFSYTAHNVSSTPSFSFSQTIASSLTYEQIKGIDQTVRNFVDNEVAASFYSTAFESTPTYPATFSTSGFQYPTISQLGVHVGNKIDGCGANKVSFSAVENDDEDDYIFDYVIMTKFRNARRFLCPYAEVCSSDADCKSGYCDQGKCAIVQPQFTYPYVKFGSVTDLSEYSGYNNGLIASFSAIIVAIIVAIIM